MFPGLEAELDFKREGALLAVMKVASPAAARRLGEGRLRRWRKVRGVRKAEETWPGGSSRPPRPSAGSCRPPRPRRPSSPRSPRRYCAPGSGSPSSTRAWRSLLADSPEARVVRTMPGMSVVFTAEFLAEVGDPSRFSSADSLAAAAEIAPVLRASGATSYQRRARRGNRVLKRVL